jgi:hypothetical protein
MEAMLNLLVHLREVILSVDKQIQICQSNRSWMIDNQLHGVNLASLFSL